MRPTASCWSWRWAPSPPAGAAWPGLPTARWSSCATASPASECGRRSRPRTSSYLRADAVEILTPSPDRVAAPCPHAGPGRCGGCDFQHVEIGAQRRLKAFRIAEQLERLAGLELGVEVEAVPGDTEGLAYRTRVRMAVDGRGAVGFRRHRSHRMEYVHECPIASPAVSATGALGVLWPGATELEVVTGTDPTEAMVSVTPRRRSAPRLPDIGTGLVVGGKVRRPPAAGAGRRPWPRLPDFAGCLLAGPRGRRGGIALGRPRIGRAVRRSIGRGPLRRCRPVLRPAGRGGGPVGLRPGDRAGPACLRRRPAQRGDLPQPARPRRRGHAGGRGVRTGPARHRRARSGTRGRRNRRHGRPGRPRVRSAARSFTSPATRRRSGATSASCSTAGGGSPDCAPSTSSP